MATYECVLILSLIYQVCGYPGGAPVSTCFTQYPKHGSAGTQTTPSPYVFTFTPDRFIPGQIVTVEVADKTGAKIRGIQIAARRATGNSEEIVGRFVDYDNTKLKAFNCYGGFQNMITHNHKGKVDKVTFKWKAPEENVGDVVFRSTLMKSYGVFWYDVLTNLTVDTTDPLQPPIRNMLPVSGNLTAIDFDDCGNTKGCFYYPRHCSGSDCVAVATYTYRQATHDYKFVLHSNHDADYISLGLSDDQLMGKDFTVSCTGRTGKMSVQEGWNPGQHNERAFNLFSSAYAVSYVDGDLQCSFVLPESFSVYQMSQDPNSYNYTTMPWNISKEWFLFLAWGETMQDSDVMAHHRDLPAISESRVNLRDKVITHSSRIHIMVRAHASLMMIAWILLTGLVTVVSRHYRDWLPETRFLGTNIWFQIHRELAILVVVLTAVGIILIFAHYGTGIRSYATPHAQVGLTVVACVGVQMIAGVFRPGGGHKLRRYFNWGHRILGHVTHILAAATMFLAFDISYIISDMKDFGFMILSVWVVVQVLWHFLFEVVSWRHSSSGISESYPMETEDGDVMLLTPEAESKSSSCYSIMFVIYLICLTGLCIAALMAFLLD